MEAASEIVRIQVFCFSEKRTFGNTKLGTLIGKSLGEQRWGPFKKNTRNTTGR